MTIRFKSFVTDYYCVGPLRLRFTTLNDARAYAAGSSKRRGRPVYIESSDGRHREVVDTHDKPKPIFG